MKLRVKNNKKITVTIALLLLMLIYIGYALLSQDLSVNGYSKINNSRWDIHFDNIDVNDDSVSLGENDSAAEVDSEDNTKVNYSITLDKPGDFYEFNVDAVNSGDIDGMVEKIKTYISINNGTPIEVTDKENDLPSYLDYSITYSDDTPIVAKHELKANTQETYKVRIEFKKDIDESDLPGEEVNLNLSIDPDIVQADGTEVVAHSGYTISFETNGGSNVESINVERESAIGELPTSTKAGYYFDGWYTEPENGDKIESDYVPIGNKIIYAYWKKSVESINASNINISEGEMKTIEITNAAEIEETYAFSSNDPLIASVNNSGKVTGNKEGTTKIIITGNTSHQTKEIDVVVTKPEEYIITLDVNGGKLDNNTITVIKGESITNLPTPTRVQYTFDGWYINLLSGSKIENGYIPEEDMILKAKWIEKPIVECTYDGELEEGAEYINGQYIYKYGHESNGSNWDEIEYSGWGVALIDKESTDPVTTPLCTTINNEPIVSTKNMFANSKAVSVDTSSFNTSNVKNMDKMFLNTQFKTIDTSNFDTSNVYTMNSTFALTKVDYLDLSSLDTSKVYEMNGMFTGSNIKELKIDGWDLCSIYTSDGVEVEIFKGADYIEKISARNMTIGYRIYTLFDIPSLKSIDVSDWNLEETYYLESIFAGSTNLSEIKGLNTWNTSNVESMYGMFSRCKNLTEIDLSGFDSSNLNDTSYMFYECDSLKKIDLTGFNIAKTNNSEFLSTNENLEIIMDDWVFDTYDESSVLYFPKATKISCKNWVLPENVNELFENNTNLTEIDVTGWDLSNTTNISNMFYNDIKLTKIIGLETWNTSNVEDMSGLFSSCESLTEVNGIKKWDTSNLTSMNSMFTGCKNIESIDISNFKSNNLSDVDFMFYSCSKLKNLNISNINIALIDNHQYFVSSNEELTIIADNWTFNTKPNDSISSILGTASNISCRNWVLPQDASSMFNGNNSKLKEINVTNWSLSNTTDLSYLFSGNTNLTTITGLDTWDTSNVENMSYMFKSCGSLTSLDLSSFNTSNVGNMSYMFAYDSKLETIDVSSFDTSSVTNMYRMFGYCDLLNKIYASQSFTTNIVSNSSEMFKNDTSLVGGVGTTYDSSKVDKEYAHLDGGNTNPGYFSERSTLRVVFNPNGGKTPISSKFVNTGSQIGELPLPTKEDGIFIGWYTGITTGTKVETNTTINNNTILYARWRKSIGAAILESDKMNLYPGTNDDIIITNANEIDETYTFTSNDTNIASVDENGKVSGVNLGTTTISIIGNTSNQTITVTIIVSENPNELQYTITYNSNGGTITRKSTKIKQGEKVGTLTIPTKEGYEFINWYTGLTDGVVVDENFIPEDDITIYARWKELPKYTLTYNPNGGVISTPSKKVPVNNSIGALPTPTRDNYAFIGWYTEISNGIKVDSDYVIDDDTTIHARWIKSVEQLTIPSRMNVAIDERKTIEISNTNNSEDYTIYSNDDSIATIDENGKLLGVSEGATTIIVKGNLSNVMRKIFTYVSNTNAQSYTITFNANGGQVEETTRTAYENLSIGKLPKPTKENSYFGGWIDENNEYYTSNTIPTNDVTLRAVWKEEKYAARINSTYYSTLQAATDEATDEVEVVLLKDVIECVKIMNYDTKINLDQNKVTGSIFVDYYASLELYSGTVEGYNNVIEIQSNIVIGSNNPNIEDGVDIIVLPSYYARGIYNDFRDGNVEFNKGNIIIEDSNSGSGITITQGSVVMNGGKIKLINTSAIGIETSGTVVITKGEIDFENAGGDGVRSLGRSSTIISNLKINFDNSYGARGLNVSNNSLTLTNTIIKMNNIENVKGLYLHDNTVNIDGLSIVANNSNEALGIDLTQCKYNINNTNITLEALNKGTGIFDDYNKDLSTISNTNINVSTLSNNINSKGFYSSYCKNIQLDNVTINSPNYGIDLSSYNTSYTLTMDDVNITITGNRQSTGVRGDTIIMNSGTINVSSEEDYANGIIGEKNITINGGTIIASGYDETYGVKTYGNTLTLNSGTISAQSTNSNAMGLLGQTIRMNGGTVKAKGSTLNKSYGFYWNGTKTPTIPSGKQLIESTDSNGFKVYTLN